VPAGGWSSLNERADRISSSPISGLLAGRRRGRKGGMVIPSFPRRSALVGLVFLVASVEGASAKEKAPMSLHELTANTIDKKPQPLSAYKDKVALVVNTASECGNTPQYAGLEKLYQSYKDKGLVVLGFPSNDFGGQEPGTEAEIKTFCSTKYKVTFPLFEKVKTKGDGQSPIYAFLSSKLGEPKWNFHKYLVGKDGKVVAAFPAKLPPESEELRAAIEAALK
jgi:glutathione peroxidase